MSATHREKVKDALAILCARWPACFTANNRRPLKIGIHVDIEASGIELPAKLSDVLRTYCQHGSYLSSGSVSGAVRTDLDGNPAGTVTAEQAAIFAHRRAMRQQRVEEAARAAKLAKAQSPAAAAPPTEPRVRVTTMPARAPGGRPVLTLKRSTV